jgi:hypothetical protein
VLGYGAHHSGAYLQPGTVGFLTALPRRWLMLVAGLATGFPPDFWLYGAEPVLLFMGGLGLVLAGLVSSSVRARMERASARRLVALCAGALVALVPLTAGIPGGRMLVVPSLASAALFGVAARRAAHAWAARERRRALGLGAWVALCGIGLNPLFRVLVPLEMARVGRELPAVARGLGERCSGATALAVGVPDPNTAYLPMLYLRASPEQRPRVFHILSMGAGSHRLTQTGPSSFELVVDGDFFALPWARIYRDTPLPPARSLALQGLDLELLEASPTRTRLGLKLSTGTPACWLTLRKGELVPLEPRPGVPLEWAPSVAQR